MKFSAEGGTSGGIDGKHFVKLKDRESIVGVFRGDPHDFRQHWVNNRSSICSGSECKLCADKNKNTFRFRVNFITKENEVYVAKVFEQGWTVYEQLKALHEGDYPLDKTIVRITRSGTGQQTTYTIIPVPKGDITPDIEKKLSVVALHNVIDLGKDDVDVNDAQDAGSSPWTTEDIPF